MPVSRLRMRPWLERMINSDTIEGLKWVDQVRTARASAPPIRRTLESSEKLRSIFPFVCLQDKTMFSIPWKHAARHGWEIEKDANLFKLWAIHTGEPLITRPAKEKADRGP